MSGQLHAPADFLRGKTPSTLIG